MPLRVIPRLDIKGPNVVKGIQFEGLRVIGKPGKLAQYYYEGGADEIIYIDSVASLYGRNSLLEIVRATAQEVFIPITVGGGLRSVDDIRTVLRAGADKISINTAALARPQLIREAAQAFGSSTVVVSIEAIPTGGDRYEALADYGRQRTGVDAIEWALRAVDLGAGELLVTSIEREGTGKGYDVSLIRQIATAVPVPVIASGGPGCVQHVAEVINQGHADAVCIASLLHYDYVKRVRDAEDDYSKEGNTVFLTKTDRSFANIRTTSLADVKRSLAERGIWCRMEGQPCAAA